MQRDETSALYVPPESRIAPEPANDVQRKLKKDYRGWHYIGYPMLAVWTVWFIYEVSVRFEDANMARAMIVGLVVGLLIGGFIGIKLERNTLKRVDEIIDSIEK